MPWATFMPAIDVLRDGGSLTRDMGGQADMKDLTAAILGAL